MLVDKVQVLGSQQVCKAWRSSHIRKYKCLEAPMGESTKYCTSRNGESCSKGVHGHRPGIFLGGHAIFIALHNSSPAFFSSHQTCHFILAVHLLLTYVPPPLRPRAPLHVARAHFILKPFAALSRSVSLGHAIVLTDYFFFHAADCFGYVIKGD